MRLPVGLLVGGFGLAVISVVLGTSGVGWAGTAYLIGAALILLAVAAVVAFTRLVTSPLSQRRIGLLIVVLPSAAIVLMEVGLYFLDDRRFSEMTEHLLTATLAAGAVPVTVFILRAFSRMREELELRARSLQMLHERSVALTAEPSLLRLRSMIAEGAVELLRSERAAHVVASSTGTDDEVVRFGVGSLAPGQREPRDAAAGVVDPAENQVDEGERVLVVKVPSDDPTAGAIVVSRSNGTPFTEEDELLLGMFSVAASAGIDNARRLEEMQFLATVDERDRIARELHDELGQLLGFLTLRIHAAQELRARGRYEELDADLADLEHAAGSLGGQVREAILGLRARVGADRALGEVLADYVQEYGLQTGIATVYDGEPRAGGDLPLAVQHQVLRVAQESLSNVRRHAQASRVVVRLEQSQGQVELSVADDGVGFSVGEPTTRLGLRTMAERAEGIGGTFEIHSSPGTGTAVRLLVPTVGGDGDARGPRR